jgi:nitrate/TMAO reductase-like tetraheme cytochrome c subunit
MNNWGGFKVKTPEEVSKALTGFTTGSIYKNPFQNKRQLQGDRDERRAFNTTQRKEILHQQDNRCARNLCHKRLDPRDIHFHHDKPWASGGRTITENGRALCGSCHNIVEHEKRLKDVDRKRPGSKNGSFGGPGDFSLLS